MYLYTNRVHQWGTPIDMYLGTVKAMTKPGYAQLHYLEDEFGYRK